MATVNVKNSTTGDMGLKAAKRSRYEKAEVAYGKIPADAYEVADVLAFTGIPMKELIHARFVASTGETLELFTGADISSEIEFDVVNDSASADIGYVVTYIRGTGKVLVGTNAGDGQLLKLEITSSAP